MINKEARRWIKDLKNGRYQQAKGVLQKLNGSCCCLGVACRVYQDKNKLNTSRGSGCIEFYVGEGDAYDNYFNTELPDDLASYFGLRTNTGVFNIRESKKPIPKKLLKKIEDYLLSNYDINSLSLVTLNDEGFTHKEIAQIMECEPKGLFNE